MPLPWLGRAAYGTPVVNLDLEFILGPFDPVTFLEGSSGKVTSGAVEAATVRGDEMIDVMLRYYEYEWPAVNTWLKWAVGSGQPFDWYFDRNTPATLRSVYLEKPTHNEDIKGARNQNYQGQFLLPIRLRAANGVRFDVRRYLSGVPWVAQVSIAPAAYQANEGSTQQLVVTVRDGNGNVMVGETITYASSNPAVATVSGTGLVTHVAPGEATITATVRGLPGFAAVRVNRVPVATVDVVPNSFALIVGATQQLTLVPRDAGGNILSLVGRTTGWGSSAPGIASVNGSGLVTAVAPGAGTIITGSVDGVNGTAAVTVQSTDPYGLVHEPQATNYVKRNVDLAHADWTVKSNVSIAGGIAIGGTTIAHRVTATAVGGQLAQQCALPGSSTARVCLSTYWKKGTSQRTIFDLIGSVSRLRFQIDPTAGAEPNVTLLTGTGATWFTPDLTIGPGWYRCYAYVDGLPGTDGFLDLWITIDAIGTGYVDLGVPQLEIGRTPTTPIRNNTSGSVTRAADECPIPTNAARFTGGVFWTLAEKLMLLEHETPTYTARIRGIYNGTSGFHYQHMLKVDNAFVWLTGIGPDVQGTKTVANVRRQRVAYVLRSNDQSPGLFSHVQGVENASYTPGTNANDYSASLGEDYPVIRYSIAVYGATDIGATAANAAQATAGNDWPATGRTEFYDFTGQSIPGGMTFTRASVACSPDLTEVAVDAPRYARGAY